MQTDSTGVNDSFKPSSLPVILSVTIRIFRGDFLVFNPSENREVCNTRHDEIEGMEKKRPLVAERSLMVINQR